MSRYESLQAALDACDQPLASAQWGSSRSWRKSHQYKACASCLTLDHCDDCRGDCLSMGERWYLANPAPVRYLQVLDAPCLLCKPGEQTTPSETAHWPLSRRYGSAVIPMCRKHHDALHWGRREIVEAVIDRAPGYWRSVGEWEQNIEVYENWCSKRRYLEAVK
jgi:hypothetical protein